MRNINLVVSMFFLFHVFEAYAQKQVVKIPISMATESKKLELSRVINVERMVMLETTTKNLLPDQFIIVPMMKGIIIIDGSRSIQSYSSTGKFIRTLSVRGNGPNEFSMISSYCTD